MANVYSVQSADSARVTRKKGGELFVYLALSLIGGIEARRHQLPFRPKNFCDRGPDYIFVCTVCTRDRAEKGWRAAGKLGIIWLAKSSLPARRKTDYVSHL